MTTVSPSASDFGMTDPARQLLRHTLATLAYRGRKALAGAPAEFANFRAGPHTRTPVAIVAHIGDLLEWALWMAKGEYRWAEATPKPWDQEVARFFSTLGWLDDYLASIAPLHGNMERLFQGPIADAIWHMGQISMLRGMAGSPVKGESYAKADIVVGRVGPEQSPPVAEF